LIPVSLAAGVAALLLVVIAALHLAIALGAPLGAFAWDGTSEVATPRNRQGSGVLAPFMVCLALIVTIRAGLLVPQWAEEMSWAIWVVFLFAVVTTVASFRSQSERERRLMGPAHLVIAALVVYVAITLGS
jgi:hypothetical protein